MGAGVTFVGFAIGYFHGRNVGFDEAAAIAIKVIRESYEARRLGPKLEVK